MKKLFALPLIFLSLHVLAQIESPYHQPFDSFSFKSEWGEETFNTYKSKLLVGEDTLHRLEINDLYSKGGKSLKITVHEKDRVYMKAKENDPRSRAEVVIRPEHGEGSEYYYSWMLFIPNDSTFPDVNPPGKSFHIISQWIEYNTKRILQCEKTQPPLKLSYQHEVNAADDFRDLSIMYGVQRTIECDPKKPRGFPIVDAIKKGEWTQITFKIHWSAYDEKGYFQMWLNGKPCIKEFDPKSKKAVLMPRSEDIDSATKIYGANLYMGKNSKPVPNYLKIGHYRGFLKGAHTLYIDDFRITSAFPD